MAFPTFGMAQIECENIGVKRETTLELGNRSHPMLIFPFWKEKNKKEIPSHITSIQMVSNGKAVDNQFSWSDFTANDVGPV